MTNPTAPEATPPAKRKRRPIRWILLGVVAIVVIASLASHKKSSNAVSTTTAAANTAVSPTSTASSPTTTAANTAPSGSGSNEASDSNTPHVPASGSVIVDTQTWRILAVKTAKTLGDQYTKQTADGVYLLVHAEVTNGKSKSVTFTSDIAKLEVNGNEYSPDSNGGTALEMSGSKTFLLKDLGPHVTTNGWVAFDVPRSVLSQKPQVCFHELGFGSSKGCIAVAA